MKFLAYSVKSGKEILQYLTAFLVCVVLDVFILCCSYISAVSTHVPLKNYDLFMQSTYSLFAVVFFFVFLVVVIVFQFSDTKEKWKWYMLLLSLSFTIIYIYRANTFHFQLFYYENTLTYLGIITFISGCSWILFSIGNRVIANHFFRALFSEEFQKKCCVTVGEENPIYRILWIKKWMMFLKRHVRNYRLTYVLDEDLERNQESVQIEKKDCKGESEQIRLLDSSILVQFKDVPFLFMFKGKPYYVEGISEKAILGEEETY